MACLRSASLLARLAHGGGRSSFSRSPSPNLLMVALPKFHVIPFRTLGTSGSGSDGDKKGESKNAAIDEEDPFGLDFEDTPTEHGNIGTDLPPSYIRDPMTGKFTGEIERELTSEEKDVLSLNQVEKEQLLVERFVTSWNEDVDDDGESLREGKVAQRIREEQMGLNTLGRSPADVGGKVLDEDGEEVYEDPSGFTKPLSQGEFKTFQEYMKREHETDVTEEDIPVQSKGGETAGAAGQDESNPDLDLTWMSGMARREMEDAGTDPFADLMPHDLNPARKVNRRRAKLLPKQLLHHNNLALLRRYMTPGGQIMSRVLTRLGAKDQRKVAKLIKRARALGLIPHIGQWKFEDHGNLHEKDLDEEREWEAELSRRGLVTPVGADRLRKKTGKTTGSGDMPN